MSYFMAFRERIAPQRSSAIIRTVFETFTPSALTLQDPQGFVVEEMGLFDSDDKFHPEIKLPRELRPGQKVKLCVRNTDNAPTVFRAVLAGSDTGMVVRQ